jgi:hypothetical protein
MEQDETELLSMFTKQVLLYFRTISPFEAKLKQSENYYTSLLVVDYVYYIINILISSDDETFNVTSCIVNDVGYVTKGKTPWATLNSVIGRDSRFLKYRGIVELKEWHLSSNEENGCPNCGKEIKKDFKFCPFCEFDLENSCK